MAHRWRETGVKPCGKCKEVKAATTVNFYASAERGLSSWCIPCQSEKAKRARKTPVRILGDHESECTKCHLILANEEFRIVNGALNCWCKECQREANRECGRKYRDRRLEYERRIFRENPAIHMKNRLLGLVRKSMDRRAEKRPEAGVTHAFWNTVGYSSSELAEHLQSKFLPGMSWENRREWHIDHIKPLREFGYPLIGEAGFLEAWALSNLQPLWAIDNMKKGASYG